MKEKKPTKEGQSISALLADSSDIPQITSNWRNKIRKKKELYEQGETAAGHIR